MSSAPLICLKTRLGVRGRVTTLRAQRSEAAGREETKSVQGAKEFYMLRRIVAATAGLLLVATTSASAQSSSGVNVGSLTCTVAGGGIHLRSSKELTCLFNQTNGVAERYTGSIKKFGVDIGFTKEAQIVWLVFAPGGIGAGALSGAIRRRYGIGHRGRRRGCQCTCWRKQQAGPPAAGSVEGSLG